MLGLCVLDKTFLILEYKDRRDKYFCMDAKLPTTLDPKLKEAYDRVMGFSVGKNQGATPQMPPSSTAVPPQMTAPQLQQTQSYQPTTVHIGNRQTNEKEKIASGATDHAAHNSSGMILAVFIALGGVILALYIFFWVKFFNISLPF